MQFVIGGSVITENIFAWPGLGRLLVRSVYARDYPVVEAGVFAIAVLLIVVNIVVELSYTVLNPRVMLR
jgi:peptide/nickel transport system permease protein